MLDEVDGPMNFTQMVTLFASKMAGGSDDDDVILQSFEAFEINGQIDAEAFRHSLMTSLAENLLPKVMRECLKASASICPLISKASNDCRMTSSSSEPPAILLAKRVTIWVKFMGPSTSSSIAWASPPPMFFPWAVKAATRSEDDRRPSLS